MKHQAFKQIAVMLGVLSAAVVPVQAGPVEYRDVVSMASALGTSGRPSVDLRLRSMAQQQQGKSSAQTPSGPQDAKPGGPVVDAPAGTSGDPLAGVDLAPQQPGTTVETIQLGEVEGTICDCGDIPVIGGGFPLWPLLGLAGVPLFFIPDDNPPDDSFPTPTPTPPSEIPEPATLLLFGSGLAALGAGARRRHARRSQEGSAAVEAREV